MHRRGSPAGQPGITWRSWFDGGMVGGPIARRWNIPHWPVVHVIDHRGVIQARNVHDDAFLDRLVDDLVIQAEQAAPRPPRTP